MIKPRKEMPRRNKVEIDLSSPDGNVFVLMAYVKRFCQELGREDDAKKLIDEMMSGHYYNAVQVLEREFGEFIILYR